MPLQRALAAPLARRRVDPNRVTLAAVPFSVAAGWCLWHGFALSGTALALLALGCDFLDGEVARQQGRASLFGNYFEACLDRWVEGAILIGLAREHPLVSSLALALSFWVSFCKARIGLVIATDNRDWPGIGDRSDRAVLMLASAALSATSWLWSQRLLWILVAITLLGGIQRLAFAAELIREAEQNGTVLPYLEGGPKQTICRGATKEAE